MSRISKEEIDQIAIKYITLRNQAEATNDSVDVARFMAYQNICIQKLSGLISFHTKKYRKFSNHSDLNQDAAEALLHALGTFNPQKGSFAWWANRYIKTRVLRKANCHSTIKIPIKRARETKPYKINTIPERIDDGFSPFEKVEKSERAQHIEKAIETLTDEQRIVVGMKYGFNGIRERPVGQILEELSISRQQYSKLLSEAENKIKKYLLRIEL